MATPTTYCDLGCEVLQSTHDGDDLDTSDIWLLNVAVNDDLSEVGERAFEDLVRRVRDGYQKPWFLGIKHLTRDQNGYVYWKGTMVEHYDHDHWRCHGWRMRMAIDAHVLAFVCTWEEWTGIEVKNEWLRPMDRHPEIADISVLAR